MDDKLTVEAELPEIELATEDWVRAKIMEMELRFEKAQHEQTKFFLNQIVPHKKN